MLFIASCKRKCNKSLSFPVFMKLSFELFFSKTLFNGYDIVLLFFLLFNKLFLSISYE